MIIQKFPYKEYPKETAKDGSRRYSIDGKALPSVTTILSATKPPEAREALQNWRDSIGHEEAKKVTKQAASVGNGLHTNLENYIKEDKKPGGPLLVQMMTNTVINRGLKNIDEYWALEVPLYVKKLYAGTADLVCIHKGKPTIGDFKNSINNKSFDRIDDYRCQVAAYALAHNSMFNTDIKKGVIMMVTQSCNYIEYVLEGKLFDESVDMWLNRLEQYYDMAN